MQYTLEIAAFNVQSALAAASAGADRIEICDNMEEGGTTPSYGTIKLLNAKLSIPVFAMLRVRGGDFCYTKEEFEVMKMDLQLFKQLGCDGIVLGFLNADGSVDKKRTSAFVEFAYPMEVTFHRAFDRAARANEALEDIINCGCQRVLTSGQMPEAGDGLPLLKQLMVQAGERIIIMPGCGIRSNNIGDIAGATGAKELHSSARLMQPTIMKFINPDMQEQLNHPMVNTKEIKAMKQVLKNIAT